MIEDIDLLGKSLLVNNYANYTAKDMIKIYSDSQKELQGIIGRHLLKTDWTLAEMKKFERDVKLFKDIDSQLVLLGKESNKLMAKNIKIMVQDTILNDAYFVEQFSKKAVNLSVINTDLVKAIAGQPWSGLPYSDLIWKDVANLKHNLKNTLMQSMILGEGSGKVARRINQAMGKGAYNASRLARTEIISAGARAQTQFAKDNADIIEGLQWVAALDNRTSRECASHHGMIKTKEEWDSYEKQIPCHPNCRCSYIMVVKDEYKIKKDVQDFNSWVKEKQEAGLIKDGTGYMKPNKSSIKVNKLQKEIKELSIDDRMASLKINLNLKNINLDGLDDTMKKMSLNSFETLQKDSHYKDFFKEGVTDIFTENQGRRAYASYYIRDKKISINYSLMGKSEDYIKAKASESLSGWAPKGLNIGVEYADPTVIHELGHAVAYEVERKVLDLDILGWGSMNDKRRVLRLNQVQKEIVRDALKKCGLKKADVALELSRYGATSAMETIAEAFSEYYCSDTPRPLSKAIVEELHEYLDIIEKAKK